MTNDKTNRCRGLELPDRALIVAARMLQNARLSSLLEGAAAGAGGVHGHPLLPSSSLSDVTKNASAARAAALAKVSSTTPASKASASAVVVARTASTIATDAGGAGNGKKKSRRRVGEPPVSREEFERLLAVCRLPYSLTWADAAYELCSEELGDKGKVESSSSTIVAAAATSESHGSGSSFGKGKDKNKKRKMYRTREQFWASFGEALVRARDDCDDLLCG